MAYIQLGEFQFQISTLIYDELTRVSSVRWSRQQIIGQNERLQATGINNDSIRLTGTFYPAIASQVEGTTGTESLDGLRATMKEMMPLLITSASGHSLGYWVIEELESANSRYSQGTGPTPRRQRFSIRLRFYGQRL